MSIEEEKKQLALHRIQQAEESLDHNQVEPFIDWAGKLIKSVKAFLIGKGRI